MTFPYLHPVSLVSAALVVLLVWAVYRRSAQRRVHPLFSLGCGASLFVLLAPILVFGVVSAFTDPGGNGMGNVLMAQITTLPLYLLAALFTDGSTSRREGLGRTLTQYRPARLVQETPNARLGRRQTLASTLLLSALLCAVFGVRFGEHLRARTLVAAQPADVGLVTVFDGDRELGRIPSAGLLRPGEIICPSVTVDFTTPDGGRTPLRIGMGSGDDILPSAAGNIIENSWVCDRYAASPRSVPFPEDLRATWQQTGSE